MTSEHMTAERFSELVNAYGADPRRWPEAERAAGLALAAQASPEQRVQMAKAAQLDGWLAGHTVAAPGDALIARIVAEADAARPQAKSPVKRRAPWWWPSAGFAGVGLAGVLTGAFMVSAALRFGAASPMAPDWTERGTSFSELSADWSEE
jgi:hypothetical protein